jgi:hypothetical protein
VKLKATSGGGNCGFWWNFESFCEGGVGFWAENVGWGVNLQCLGKSGKKNARKMGVKVYKN